MKKFVSLLLVALMIVGLAACGGSPAAPADSNQSANQPSGSQPASQPSGDGVAEITYSYWGTPDEAESVQAVADKFNADHPNIHVTVMSIPNEEYVTKLNTMAVAKELPDCGIMSESGVLDFASKGLLADISGMYEGAASMPLDSITFKSEGKPVAYSAANEVLFLYYNKDMFDAAGLDYPSASEPMSWDEFVSLAKLLTLDASGKNATEAGFDTNSIVQFGCNVDNWTWQLEVWALSNGGRWFSADGKECTINTPEVAESIQKVADLYLVEKVAQYRPGLEDSGIQSTIGAGNVAMATGGAWNVGTCMNGVDFNYGVARLPYMKNAVTICTGGPQVVFSQSKHPAEAMEFIKWYMQEENSWDSLIATGIWMPILEEYYTDETLTRKWVENPNFPAYDEYKAAVVDYAMSSAQSTCWYYVPHTTEFIEYLRSILGPVWTGEQTAADALANGYNTLNSIFLDD